MASQSPAHAAQPRLKSGYLQGWAAVNRLIHQGQSWSGREKNRAFLNLRDGTFADIATAAEINFIDDARAVAISDWDHDGDLDLWLTNRTAPIVRFLKNNSSRHASSFALRLTGNGTTCNRDAIGARVELILDSGETLTQSLYAGSGLLAQSTRWLHFGFPDESRPEKLGVNWPNGQKDEFEIQFASGRYQLDQRIGKLKPVPAGAASHPLPAGHQTPMQPPATAHVLVVRRVPAPVLEYKGNGGQIRHLTWENERPVLVNLWASWCAPCLEELSTWPRAAAELEASGLRILALSVDGLGDAAGATCDEIERLLQRLQFQYDWGMATERSVLAFEVLQQALITQRRNLPIPSSFLFDRRGRVAAIYKGPVDLQQVLSDLELAEADAAEIRSQAAPFPGRWLTDLGPPDPMDLVIRFIDTGDLAATESYLERCLQFYERDLDSGHAGGRADLQYFLGCVYRDQGRLDEALSQYRAALAADGKYQLARRALVDTALESGDFRLAQENLALALQQSPDDAELWNQSGIAHLQLGQLPNAAEQFQESLRLDPGQADAQFNLGMALQLMGRSQDAVVFYRQALEQRPGWTAPMNNLAWILATDTNPDVRDGAEAVRLAQNLIERLGEREPSTWDTLAAAYAETADFPQAISAAEQALRLAEDSSASELADRIQERLAAYRRGQPHRQPEP